MKKIFFFLFSLIAFSPLWLNANPQSQEDNLVRHSQKFDDWPVSCFYEKVLDTSGKETGKGILKECQSLHIFAAKAPAQDENSQPIPREIMRMYVVYEPTPTGVSKDPSLFFHVPLRAFLQPQIAVYVDKNDAIIVPYNVCEPSGCFAGGRADDFITSQFQEGSLAKIVFFNASRQPISLDLSLKGYSKAMNYLAEQSQNYGKTVEIPQ